MAVRARGRRRARARAREVMPVMVLLAFVAGGIMMTMGRCGSGGGGGLCGGGGGRKGGVEMKEGG